MNSMPTFVEDCVTSTRKAYQSPARAKAFTDLSGHPKDSLIRTLFDTVASLKSQLNDPQSAFVKQHEATLRAFLAALLAGLRKSKSRSASESAGGADRGARGEGTENGDLSLSDSLALFEAALQSKLIQWSHDFGDLSDAKFVLAVCEVKYYELCFAMFEAYVAVGGKKGDAFTERAGERDVVVGVMKEIASKNQIVQKHGTVKRKEGEAFPN